MKGKDRKEADHVTAHQLMRQGKGILTKQQGIALLMSLLMLFLISILGMAGISLSGADLQSTGYERKSTRAFSAAESGLTQARNDLQVFIVGAPNNGQWPASDSTVITGIMGESTEKSYTIPASGETLNFSYQITDFGTGTDRTVLITSTGTFQNVQQRVEAIFRYEPPGAVGSQECYNTKCTSVDQSSGKTVNFTGSPNSTITL